MYIEEENRLEALKEYSFPDTETQKVLGNLTKLAAQICGTSGSQINFLGENWQWALATTGWGSTHLPREIGFCKHAVQSENLCMVVEDALKDDRFIDNTLVNTPPPPLRFYAGITIKSEDKHPLGTLCVYDSEPKQLTDQQLESLQILANEVETHLKFLVNQDLLKERLLQENKFNQKVMDFLPGIFLIYNESGELVRWNYKVPQITGYSEQEIIEMQALDFFSDEDRELVAQNIAKVFHGREAQFEASIIAKDSSSIPFKFSVSSFEMDNQFYLMGFGQNNIPTERGNSFRAGSNYYFTN